jgi:hypothetical protein
VIIDRRYAIVRADAQELAGELVAAADIDLYYLLLEPAFLEHD